MQYKYLITLFIFFVLSFLCVFYFTYYSPPIFVLDDPYIVLHNISVLRIGIDVNYPGVSALTGTTSLIHLSIVALFSFFMSPVWALMSVVWLSIFLYVFGLLRLAFQFSLSPLMTIVFVITGSLLGNTFFHFLSGLETGLAMAAVVWLFVLLNMPNQRTVRILRCLFMGWFPFLRPEFILLSALIYANQAIDYWKIKSEIKFVIKNLLMDGVMIFLCALPWILWNFINLGTPYPETIHAKAVFFAEKNAAFFSKKIPVFYKGISRFVLNTSVIFFIGSLFLLCLTRVGRLGFIFILMLLTMYLFYFPLAPIFNYNRYIYIIVPILLYAVISTWHSHNLWIRYFSHFILILALIQNLCSFPMRWEAYVNTRHYYATEIPALADWCHHHIPAKATILIHDAGYLSYATSYHLIDMVGLKSPSVIPYHENLTLPSNGKSRILAISEIIRDQHPNYLIVVNEWNNVFGIATGLEKIGIHLKTLRSGKQGYWVYKIEDN